LDKISRKDAILLCEHCKQVESSGKNESQKKKECIALDYEILQDEYVVLQECMLGAMDSQIQKTVQPHEQIENERDTKSVSDSPYVSNSSIGIPPFFKTKGVDTKKVRDFFINHPDFHVTPLALSHISHDNAKKICKRWKEKGWLQQTLKSHYEYQQKITATDLELLTKIETIKVHDLRLKVPIISGDKDRVTLSKRTSESIKDCGGISNSGHRLAVNGETSERIEISENISHPENYEQKPEKTLQTFDAQGRPQTDITIFRHSKELEIQIKCSKNPLDILALQYTMGFIQGAGYDLTGAYFYLIEVNIDIPGLQIDGAQSIKLKDFRNCVQRYYNKKGKLRKEFILRGKIPIEEVIAVMRGEQTLGTNILAAELEMTKKELRKVTQQMIKTDDNYRKIIAKESQKILSKKEEFKLKDDNEKLKQENERLKKQQEEMHKTSR
jgi:hypothetical protein